MAGHGPTFSPRGAPPSIGPRLTELDPMRSPDRVPRERQLSRTQRSRVRHVTCPHALIYSRQSCSARSANPSADSRKPARKVMAEALSLSTGLPTRREFSTGPFCCITKSDQSRLQHVDLNGNGKGRSNGFFILR